MHEFATVFEAVVPVFLVIAAGLVLRRVNWLTEEADASLLRLTINLLVPCLAFDSILGNPAVAVPRNLLLAPLVGFGTVMLGLAVAGVCARAVPAETPATRRTFTFAVAVYNYGYVPLPLAMSLFDRDTVAVLFVHNLGVELALWSSGLLLLAGANPRREWRKLLSPPLVSIFAAVVLNAVIGEQRVPGAVRAVAHMLGQCAIPMGMLLIGATMADHLRPFAQARGGRAMALACGLRLGVLPLLFLGLAWVLPASTELRRVMVLEAAMPAAVFPIVMARHYGGDVTTALRVVVTTSLASLVTIPLWIQAGLRFLRL
jgi:predicted permease